MKGAARPPSSLMKPGTQARDRGKSPPAPSFGMRPSRSSNSLGFESRLSRLKRASSEDTLNKPGGSTPTNTCRLRKTTTTGAISELAEARPRSATGSASVPRRTGIPAPRDLPVTVTRERAALRSPAANAKKPPSSPISSSTPVKHLRATTRQKQENDASDKTVLESQVKELLAEAKTKDFEISKLRSELKKFKNEGSPSPEVPNAISQNAEGESISTSDPELLIRTLKEQNQNFQFELSILKSENQMLKERLISLEPSPVSEMSTSNDTDSSLPTLSPQGPSLIKSPSSASEDYRPPRRDGLQTSGSSSSDVTKASLSPDASDFEHIDEVPSRPLLSHNNPLKSTRCSTGGSSSNNISEISVASLTEKIQKMEESHHSTSEELQATLQELSDQQQMVQELSAESEKLAEEKTLLEKSFHQQRDRAEQLRQDNERLTSRLKEQEADMKSRILELDQKYSELVEKSRFEREKLLGIQQQLTSSLRSLEKDHQDGPEVIKGLREDTERLQKLLDSEEQKTSSLAKTLADCQGTMEGLKLENNSLKAKLFCEKQKTPSINASENHKDNSDIRELLKNALLEKEQLEIACTELKQELLKANSEVKRLEGQLTKVETERCHAGELSAKQEEQLRSAHHKLQERVLSGESELKDLKDTIFELEDQVEQHRAVKLHNNQTIRDLEGRVIKLEEQKLDLEKQMKSLNKQMKEDAEEWKFFQADLQTAVVVANDIKNEAQQELRTVRRRLQEEEERSARLQKELEEVRGCRLKVDEVDAMVGDPSSRWKEISVNPAAPLPSDAVPTVKLLIKSFDSAEQGSTGQNMPIQSPPRSLLSGIPVRTAPAAAVSPMQRHSISSLAKSHSTETVKRSNVSTDLLRSRDAKPRPDFYLRKSPSLESLHKPLPLGYSSRVSSFTGSRFIPQSKLSVERKDPLAALAREYGGSKRNALLKWCQKKTEGYPNIDITNFSSSWSDGLAFCAILHTYLPAHIPYQDLNGQDKRRNLLLAFQAAESVGIKPSLELNQLLFTDRPDWQSVMQYMAQIYKYFET
ncbi:cytospin-B isoform X1 [Lissotriton helveticus]